MVYLSSYFHDYNPFKRQQLDRIVTPTRKFDRMTSILKKHHQLAIRYHIVKKILLVLYNALNRAVPFYIGDLLNYRTSRRTLRSSSQHLLTTPKARLKTHRERTFAVAAPRLWSSIPLGQRPSSSINSFKTFKNVSF